MLTMKIYLICSFMYSYTIWDVYLGYMHWTRISISLLPINTLTEKHFSCVNKPADWVIGQREIAKQTCFSCKAGETWNFVIEMQLIVLICVKGLCHRFVCVLQISRWYQVVKSHVNERGCHHLFTFCFLVSVYTTGALLVWRCLVRWLFFVWAGLEACQSAR